jgi:tRNA nucleotidyltransferase (CCA-adding enzyme)
LIRGSFTPAATKAISSWDHCRAVRVNRKSRMSNPYVGHQQVAAFAADVVNLKREDVQEYRAQVNRLRERLEVHIRDHPAYALVKMLHSGSVAKGTALSTINDMDVAVYVRAADAPPEDAALLDWLATRLREAYPTMKPEQFVPQSHCVKVSFRGSGLDVDVVPVLYEDEPDGYGCLITKETGDRVVTSIPFHLAFIRDRKNAQREHFAQVVRLLKWWVREQKKASSSFRFKSFMVELLCAHLADSGLEMSDYAKAMEAIFASIVTSGLKRRIAFADYYDASALPESSDEAVQIYDPVNPVNNVAARYSETDRQAIVEAAHDALDALNEARYATTQGRAVALWQTVLGPSFKG